MLTSAVRLHWLPLAVALFLLLRAQPALATTFHLVASSPAGATFGTPPVAYSVQYDLTLIGREVTTLRVRGVYIIIGVSGTRTFDNGVDEVTTVNLDVYAGVPADSVLYFGHAAQLYSGGGFIDPLGFGYNARNTDALALAAHRQR